MNMTVIGSPVRRCSTCRSPSKSRTVGTSHVCWESIATLLAAGWNVMPPGAGRVAGDVRPHGHTRLARVSGAHQLGENPPPPRRLRLV